jgi:hypothetical protein
MGVAERADRWLTNRGESSAYGVPRGVPHRVGALGADRVANLWVESSDVARSSGGARHGAGTDRDAVRGPYRLGGSSSYCGAVVIHGGDAHGDGYVAGGVAACSIGIRSGCGWRIWRGGWVVPG